MTLTPKMISALDAARAGDRRLFRWPGGYWSSLPYAPGATVGKNGAPPGEWWTAQTIDALLKRGLVAVDTRYVVAMTEAGDAYGAEP